MKRARPVPKGWASLPTGRFTGIDWSQADALHQSDPYLAWAETSGFAGFRSPLGQTAEPSHVPLLLELADEVSVTDLLACAPQGSVQVPKVYQHLGPGLRCCTARATPAFFAALSSNGSLRAAVKRLELGLPVGHHSQALPTAACANTQPDRRSARPGLDGDVAVVIDNGLALGHADFLHPGTHTSRVAAFWRQDSTQGPHGRAAATRTPQTLDPARCGAAPTDMGYGHELTQSAIDKAIAKHTHHGRVDEDALARHRQMWDLQHHRHHGTHVASLMAGPRAYVPTMGTEDSPPVWTPSRDAASRAKLLVVQLDWASVADSSGGALCVSVLDALAWALARCAPSARITVNLSWGALAGPHNGSALLETAMAQLIAASGRNATLVIPAGNAYQARTHANALLRPERPSVELHWRVQPDDHSQSFLELWFEDHQDPTATLQDLRIELTPPGAAKPLPALHIGQSAVWPSADAPQCAVLFPHRSALGHPGSCALVALAPTASWHPDTVRSAPGRWTVRVTYQGRGQVVMDAYIERDDVALGSAPTGARQSYLEDARYDTSGGLDGFIDHASNPSLVRRSGTFNDIATGAGTVSVGGIRCLASGQDPMARYSPRTPDPDAQRPARQGVKKVPDQLAVSDDSAAVWGVRSAGTRSASRVRLVGTSMAAPQVARQHLNRKP